MTALDVEGGDANGGADVVENVSFSFNKISVEYVPQGKDGQPMGGTIVLGPVGRRVSWLSACSAAASASRSRN